MIEKWKYQYWLSCIKGVGNKKRKKLVEYCGSAKEVYALTKKQLMSIPKINEKEAEAVVFSRLNLDLEKEADVQREPEGAMEEESQPEGMMDNEDEAGEALAQNEDRETEVDETAETVVFTVKKGEPAYSIEDRMKEEGLLPEDVDFDRFLVDNGYDTKIVAAEYEIPIGVDMETIARIITKQR